MQLRCEGGAKKEELASPSDIAKANLGTTSDRLKLIFEIEEYSVSFCYKLKELHTLCIVFLVYLKDT